MTAPIAVHPNGTPLHQVGIVAALPQLLGVLFDRTRDLSGMSPARWCLGAGSCASWTTYGWPLGRPTVWLSAGFGLVCAVAICADLRTRWPAPAVARQRVSARRAALAAAWAPGGARRGAGVRGRHGHGR